MLKAVSAAARCEDCSSNPGMRAHVAQFCFFLAPNTPQRMKHLQISGSCKSYGSRSHVYVPLASRAWGLPSLLGEQKWAALYHRVVRLGCGVLGALQLAQSFSKQRNPMASLVRKENKMLELLHGARYHLFHMPSVAWLRIVRSPGCADIACAASAQCNPMQQTGCTRPVTLSITGCHNLVCANLNGRATHQSAGRS